MGLPFENASAKLKTLKQNDINKCFDKKKKGRSKPGFVRTRPSGRVEDSGRDTFKKENLITRKININKPSIPWFLFGLVGRVGPGFRGRHTGSPGAGSAQGRLAHRASAAQF